MSDARHRVYEWLAIGRRPFGLLVILYLAATTVGLVFVARRGVAGNAVQLLATRDLRRNHRVIPADLRETEGLLGADRWRLPDRSGIQGKYLVREVPRAGCVSNQDVSEWPDLHVDAASVAMVFPSPDELTDAGSHVDICDASGKCLVQDATVVAVLCGSSGSCRAIVAVPSARASEVRAAAKEQKIALQLVTL